MKNKSSVKVNNRKKYTKYCKGLKRYKREYLEVCNSKIGEVLTIKRENQWIRKGVKVKVLNEALYRKFTNRYNSLAVEVYQTGAPWFIQVKDFCTPLPNKVTLHNK